MFDHKHFLGLENFPREDIQKIIDTAFEFKEVLNRPIKKSTITPGSDDC